jgi:hypothetical protein
MRKNNNNDYLSIHNSFDLNDLGLLNYEKSDDVQKNSINFQTGITEQCVVESIKEFLTKHDISVKNGYENLLLENICVEKKLNESLKWWKGKFSEMVLTTSLLPDKINNNICYYEYICVNYNSNLKNFLQNFKVNFDNILFIDDFLYFFNKINHYKESKVSCLLILYDISHFMGPDCYQYFFDGINNKEIIIKGAVKFFSKLNKNTILKNRKSLIAENYFTKNKEIELKKNIKENFLELENNLKPENIFNFYLELPFSNFSAKENDHLIDFKNLENFVNEKLFIQIKDLINSILINQKKYFVDNKNANVKEVELFFGKDTKLKRSCYVTKNVSLIITDKIKNPNSYFENFINQNIKKENKEKIYFIQFSEFKLKNYSKMWLGFVDLEKKIFNTF